MNTPASSSGSFSSEIYEAPPQEVRRKKFTWASFGGNGFLVSLGLHLMLLLIAIFWVVSTFTEEKEEPTTFVTGAGGGTGGQRAQIMEQRYKPRNARNMVKTPSKLIVKGASTGITLPDMPSLSMNALESGSLLGGSSKGMGGGSGGGVGTGQGVGTGGGRNLVSLFGARGRTDRLTGYIYDFTQTRDGQPNANRKKYNRSNNLPWLSPLVTTFLDSGWNLSRLDRYFRGPTKLGVNRILIPRSPDSAAPEAFEAAGKMEGSAWIAVYQGKVRAPFDGEIRFAGTADNYLAVSLDRKLLLTIGCGRKPSPHQKVQGLRQPVAVGDWIRIEKGRWYDMNVLIGDAGGLFSAALYYEKKKELGKKYLFHTEDLPWDDVLRNDRGDLPRDFASDSPVWLCNSASSSLIR